MSAEWTNERHQDARAALEEDMSQWGMEYGSDALDEIERLRLQVERLRSEAAVSVWVDYAESQKVKPGLVIVSWPENDEHLRGWVLLDSDGPGDEWWWEPRRDDAPGYHWRFPNSCGFKEPEVGPWIVRRRAPLDYGYSEK